MISSIQIDALQRPCLPLGRTHRGLFAVHKSMCPMLIRATLHYGNWIHGTGLQDQCSVSDTHLLTHQTRWTCFTDNTVGWKRHTDIFYVCNFKSSFLFLNNNGFHCSISPLQQEAISTLGLRQIKYIKHPPVSCDSVFPSELLCSSSDFVLPSRSRLTGTSLVAVKGHGTGGRGGNTGRNGD